LGVIPLKATCRADQETVMQQYSLFTHGNVLGVETPANLANFINVGWGTQVTFRRPVYQDFRGLPVADRIGPGSWFHLPLTSTLTTFGKRNPYLQSVTLLFDTVHCRITDVDVWDGASMVARFVNLRLKGNFLFSRNTDDVDPEAKQYDRQTFQNTIELSRPHRVFSAIGLSFYACAYLEDFDERGFAPGPNGPFPPAILTLAAAGAQFSVTDTGLIHINVGGTHIAVDP
jgi:hypothetical protein